MPDIIRLYFSRNTDETVQRLKDYQFSNIDEPVAALEIRETVLCGDVTEAIVDLIRARGVVTVQLDDCAAYIDRRTTEMAWALGSVKNVRLSEPTFLSHDFLDSLLSSATTLNNLRIQDHFCSRQIEALANGLKENNSIQVLDLSRSRFDSFEVLADGLKENKRLKVLKLRSLGLNDDNMNVLLESIQNHPCLEAIDLSFNHCQHLDNLATLINDSSNRLTEISLGYQNLWQSPKVNISSLVVALRSNKRLKKLSLARNKLTDTDMLGLSTALACNDTLENLDLRENFLSDDGVSILATIIGHGTHIRRISLGKNPFQEAGAMALLKAAESNYNLFHVDINETTLMYQDIRHSAALNKGGRRLLVENVCRALWPLVLERINRLDFGDGDTSFVGYSFGDNTASLQLDVMHFIIRGPALCQGALLYDCH